MHLEPAELVDIAEGTRAESSAPHLAACAACRRQLADMKATIAAAAAVEVPEPSPLFWDHLSARVRAGVAAEEAPRQSFWAWPRVLLPAGVAVAAVLIAALARNASVVPPPRPVASTAPSASPAEFLADPSGANDDTALTLVADLSDDLDFDTAREAGLAGRGSAEHAVTHLNGGELRELRRLLQEELARSGA